MVTMLSTQIGQVGWAISPCFHHRSPLLPADMLLRLIQPPVSSSPRWRAPPPNPTAGLLFSPSNYSSTESPRRSPPSPYQRPPLPTAVPDLLTTGQDFGGMDVIWLGTAAAMERNRAEGEKYRDEGVRIEQWERVGDRGLGGGCDFSRRAHSFQSERSHSFVFELWVGSGSERYIPLWGTTWFHSTFVNSRNQTLRSC